LILTHRFLQMKALISLILLAAMLLLGFGCKKDNNTNPDGDETNTIAQTYQNFGYGFIGRYDTYYPDQAGSFFITPLDFRLVNGKYYGAWIMQEEFDNSTTVYSGTFKDYKFVKSDYVPCGDPTGTYDFFRDLFYEFDNQGNLFTAYRYKALTSSSTDWTHSYCSSSGLSGNGEFQQFPLQIRENNGQVSAVGVSDQSGQGSTGLKFHQYNGSGWEISDIPGVQPNVQAFDYYVSGSGTGFVAYTSAEGVDVEGKMNLSVYEDGNWQNAGRVSLPDIRKFDVDHFIPYKVRIVRNDDRPYIILYRDYNTIAVLRYNGTELELAADPVTFPVNSALQFTVINKPDLCVYQDKLTALGYDNNTGAITDPRSVYQLNGNAFTLLHQVVFSNVTVTGVYSDNEHLWLAGEVKRFDAEDVFSPVDIIEVK
jgi:hypothetical protein